MAVTKIKQAEIISLIIMLSHESTVNKNKNILRKILVTFFRKVIYITFYYSAVGFELVF